MAGKITHKWTGTVLTITSDSGTSSADLKGSIGDMGPRGCQGPAGVIYNADGEIVMEGYATEEYVNHLMDNIDLTDYATKTDVQNAVNAIPQPDWSAYATKEYVGQQIEAIPETDLTGYATETFVNEKIAAIPQTDLTGLATETYVNEKVNEAIEAIPDIDFSGLATETYVDEKIAEIPEPDMTGYATENYVDIKIAEIHIPELDNYATKDYVDITSTTALSNYYTRDEVDEVIANLEPGTGGGGGADNNAVLTMKNTSGWLYKVVAPKSECIISGYWSSLEDGLTTGNGVLSAEVNGSVKYLVDVPQGAFSFDIAPYLATGANKVKVYIYDAYNNQRSIIYNVEVVAVSLTTTFEKDTGPVAHTGAISFPYVATGNVEKRMVFLLDGSVAGSETITTSGRQKTFTIPAQKHGSHTFEAYFTATISGMTVESEHLKYDLICTEEGNNTPIISVANNRLAATQYEAITFYYSVYTPNALTSNIELLVNNKSIKELTVDRTPQPWEYRADETGSMVLKIKCGDTTKSVYVGVNASEMDVEAETADLKLHLTSLGRNNQEKEPATWTYGDIVCGFENYNWKSDGWIGGAHRITGDARLTIPFYMFQTDARETGKTIEIEFATRDTMDYDTVIASCMSGGIGFEMTAQKATIKSEQAAITTPYKEDEHIRLTFVIEKRAENRLIYTYLNGIMCGAVQYEANDNFAQTEPVGLTIGSNQATIDIYSIRVYDNSLTRYQVLDNWIADTQDIDERLARYKRNKVYDAYGSVVSANLPKNLPYLILEAPALPDAKDNPTPVKATYVDPQDESKNFVHDAIADVQGTSSAGYVRKNYIITYPETFKLREDSIPTNIFTYKADVASSEGANNVELVRLYNNITPYKTPPQLENASVRQGIDGFPIVIFHNDGTETKFIGKYNFNNDKETPEVFGFAEGDESWEIRNNTSNRVLFKSADFSGTDWLNDFKARFPVGSENAEKLAAFAEWVVSTDTTGLNEIEAAARLQKFKTELPNYAEVDSALFYYLFTELFLMVDSRAKNAFPTFYNGNKVCWLPYDMDTAMGINNEGALTFGYELEDTDTLPGGADVYNGQKSVFWNNLRDTYGEELKEMYQTLRTDNVLSYDIVEQMFEEHQSKWPEAIWNEDAWYKYLQPLVENNNGSYLGMLQGSKEEQRKWWLYNRFRYMDSKYIAGDAQKDFITLRGYEKADITLEPYADIYATILYGSYWVQERALRGSEYTLECPMDTLNDTEIYIYSSSQLKSIGDLSGLKVGYADFSMATRLQNLKLGDASSSYSNGNLKELYLGNNTLLQTLDVRNCSALGTGEKQKAVNLSGCTNIEHIYFDGTAIQGCTLPNGGILKTLHLPSTITNLTILNQKALTDLSVPSYENLSTLRLENVGENIGMEALLRGVKAGSRVRLIGIDWSFDTAAEVKELYDILDTMKGLDENDINMDKAQVSGTIYVPEILSTDLEELQNRYPTITILYDAIAYNVIYVNYDGRELYKTLTREGTKAIDPVATGKISTPTKPSTAGYTYTYYGWDSLPTITSDITLTAQFTAKVRYYTVSFVDNGTTLQTASVPYGSTAKYNGTRPADTDTTLFAGWYPKPGKITGNTTYNALRATKNSGKEITDSWETIFANVDNGTYASKYGHGDYKKLELGNNGGWIYMRIIGFYDDDKADGSGEAVITWMADNALKNKRGWSSWSTSPTRTYLNGEFLNSCIPATVRNRLALIALPTGSTSQIITNDYVWMPSKSNDFLDYKDNSYPSMALKENSSNYELDTSDSAYWLRDSRNVYFKSPSSAVLPGWGYGSTERTQCWIRICFATN
jgi:hypothetical protein